MSSQRRYTGRGVFTDRDGHTMTLTSLTFAVEPERGDLGGRSSSLPPNDPEGRGGAGETPSLFERTEDPVDGFDPLGGPNGPQEPQEEPVTTVWTCYVNQMEPRRTEMDAEERKLIKAALKVASVEECCRAIHGCKSSAFHMGDNDRNRKYNRLSQIIKGRQGRETTRERIDYFIDIFNSGGTVAEVTSETQFKIDTLKDRVRRGNGNGDGEKAESELWDRFGVRTKWSTQTRGGREVRVPTFVSDGHDAEGGQ